MRYVVRISEIENPFFWFIRMMVVERKTKVKKRTIKRITMKLFCGEILKNTRSKDRKLKVIRTNVEI